MLPPGNQHLQPSPHGSHEHEHVPSCPRCASTDTKFCYYNNYSLAQPRYFCKACRRYWTRGGALRNVPVGGGCRRRRRSMARRPQSNGHSSLYSCNSGDNSSSTSDSCSSNGQKPNVEINMAAVFANYLNPGSCFKPQAVSESLRNDCLFDVPDQGGCVGFEPLQDSFSHGMLVQDDGFWSSPSYNGNSSDLSTEFTDWEAMVHLKDLDSLPLNSISSAVMEDHFQSSSTNQVISDINWSCFDLEGYTSSLLPSVDS